MGKLWETVDLIRSRGMCKGVYDGSNGSHCALGFIAEAHDMAGYMTYVVPSSHPSRSDMETVATVIREVFPDRVPLAYADTDAGTIACFNNDAETTKDDLELVFEKAAIRSDEIISA